VVGEQIGAVLGADVEWEPVHGFGLDGVDRSRIERDASEVGLQPVRWPAVWPPDTRPAMLAATYAKQVGRAVAFSLAAFRQAFAGGRDLGNLDTVLIAAAACEMHPTAVLKALELRSVASGLERAVARARDAGVTVVPAIEIDGRLFAGPDALTEAIGART
jgi:predicted DsbA family dithiol-disulfide isomerase